MTIHDHSLLKDIFDKNNNLLKKYDSIVQMSAYFAAGDTEKRGSTLVEEDAIINCSENMWCSLFHVLALSSVIQRKINLHYPDNGLSPLKAIFNQQNFTKDLNQFTV